MSRPEGLSRHIAWRYIRQGGRSRLVSFMSAIAVAGLSLSVAVLITVLSVLNGFDREMRRNVLQVVPHITLRNGAELGQADWDQAAAIALRHPQVTAAVGLAELSGVIATAGANQGLLILGIDPARDPLAGTLDRFIVAGEGARSLDNSRWRILLGASLARRLEVGVGDSVDLFSPSFNINPLVPLATFRGFEVAGIYRVGSGHLDEGMALIPLRDARALFRLRGPYNAMRFYVEDVLTADRVMGELAPAMPRLFSMQSWTVQFGGIYENILFSRNIIAFMLWLLVAVAAFNLVVSLIMVVRDKRGDIAILRTLGAEPRLIYRVFIWQGGLIGLIGLGGGLLLGVAAALSVSDLTSLAEGALGVQIFNAEVYPIDFLPSQLRWGDVAVVSAGVMFLSLLATLYPARRAAAIQPAEALRGE